MTHPNCYAPLTTWDPILHPLSSEHLHLFHVFLEHPPQWSPSSLFCSLLIMLSLPRYILPPPKRLHCTKSSWPCLASHSFVLCMNACSHPQLYLYMFFLLSLHCFDSLTWVPHLHTLYLHPFLFSTFITLSYSTCFKTLSNCNWRLHNQSLIVLTHQCIIHIYRWFSLIHSTLPILMAIIICKPHNTLYHVCKPTQALLKKNATHSLFVMIFMSSIRMHVFLHLQFFVSLLDSLIFKCKPNMSFYDFN